MAILKRATFTTSRLLEFYNRKELTLQTGHEPEVSPLVILKELVNNALDSCGEATRAPVLSIEVEPDAIVVSDNGAGLPVATLDDILDFSVRCRAARLMSRPIAGSKGTRSRPCWQCPSSSMARRGAW
jgi:signal transduction histidine kinase